MEAIFFISIVLIAYTYLVFPLFLKILSLGKKNNEIIFSKTGELPFISIIIPAHNEEEIISEKIKSIYQTSYPLEKIEIIIGSDASTDNTNNLLNKFSEMHKELSYVIYNERMGKANVVNELVKKTKGSIIILTDANVIFEKETIFEMVKHFKNSEIGLVDSNMNKCNIKSDGISFQEKTYISWESKIKNKEGKIWGTMIGPFGGCFAVRKDSYFPVRSNFLVDDFYINMKVIENNKKAISEMKSMVYEDVSNDLKEETRRKERIATGNFQNLFHFKHLLFSKIFGLSFCFISHKVIRWFVRFLMTAAFFSNLFLINKNSIYGLLFLLQIIIILIPVLDLIMKKANIHISAFRFFTHFYFMNYALFIGFFKYVKGVKSGVWQPTKRNQ